VVKNPVASQPASASVVGSQWWARVAVACLCFVIVVVLAL